jgi:hypothetical protein
LRKPPPDLASSFRLNESDKYGFPSVVFFSQPFR